MRAPVSLVWCSSERGWTGSSGPRFTLQKFETCPDWGAKFQNPSLDSKPSTVGLFIGIGVTHPEKTLKLVKLSNNFLMHAIDFGYQRR
jgi:hypothetical protein